MSLLLANDLKRHFGAHDVLRGVSLRIESGDKLGLVGRNGGGKTTLLRILEGEQQPDAGSVVLTRGARLGYVRQRAEFPAGISALAYVESGLDEAKRLAAELTRLEEAMGQVHGEEQQRLVERHGEALARMEFLGGWHGEQRVEQVLSGIGLHPALWEREAAKLSGGEKSRVLLARELVSAPDVLLLDEPTNHLDLAGIEWIEDYIKALKGAVLVVSHDRRLLDNVVDAIYELERGELKRFAGGYTTYVRLKEERFASDLHAWEVQQDFLRKEEDFIRRHMGSQRTAEAKGRQKKLEHLVRLPQPLHEVRRPVIRLKGVERGGELVFETRGLRVGHPGKTVIESVDLRLARGERMGIVGRNGSGKTTLLKTLAGKHAALGGEVELGHKATCGYFDQESAELNTQWTPHETIRRDQPAMTDLEIRSHLARFLFRGAEVDAQVSTLSGGERARLALARLVLEQPSWLALDEPTNHLDLAARTALEEFLGEWPGALVVISHDREFLDSLCGSILELREPSDGGPRRVMGNYSAWHAKVLGERSAQIGRKDEAEKEARKQLQRSAEQQSKGPAEPASRAGNQGKLKNPWLLKKVEQAIIALEGEKESLLAALASEEVFKNGARLREAQTRLAEVERELEERNGEWERWI